MSPYPSLVCGVDIGLGGGVAFYSRGAPKQVSAYPMPVVAHAVDGAALARLLQQYDPDLCAIEAAGPRPLQGTVSTFGFGRSFGTVLGVVQALNISHRVVSASSWKRFHGLIGKSKEGSRAAAIARWPASTHFAKKSDDGKAEASLLALFASETLLREGQL